VLDILLLFVVGAGIILLGVLYWTQFPWDKLSLVASVWNVGVGSLP